MIVDISGTPVTLVGLALALLGLMIGGWVKGLLGLGLPMASLPLLTHVIGLKGAVSLLSLSIITGNVWQAFQGGHFVRMMRRFWLIAVTMAFGIFSGVWALAVVDLRILYAAAGLAVLLSVANAWFRPEVAISPRMERWLGPFVGLFAGVLGGASSLFGPPLIIFLVGLKLEKDDFVAGVGFLYLCGGFPLIASLIFHDLMGREELLFSAAAVLPVGLGIYVGQRLRQRLDGPLFAKLILGFMLLLAGSLIAKAI